MTVLASVGDSPKYEIAQDGTGAVFLLWDVAGIVTTIEVPSLEHAMVRIPARYLSSLVAQLGPMGKESAVRRVEMRLAPYII